VIVIDSKNTVRTEPFDGLRTGSGRTGGNPYLKNRPFKQVDVFTATPYLGNPLAVVLDGAGLSDAEMAAFSRWTNLSETTFLLPPTHTEADYRVRIFTPDSELPFAGHPTLGTCHAWLEAGGKPKKLGLVVQESAVGLVRIRQTATTLAFAAPALKRSALSASKLAQVAGALGISSQQIIAAQFLDNGAQWLGLLLDSTDTVLQIIPNYITLKSLRLDVGVAGVYDALPAMQLIAKSSREARAFSAQQAAQTASTPAIETEIADIEVRAFMQSCEDPVTGSLNASLAQWLIEDGYLPESYTASQGMCLDRAGRVSIERDACGQIWVGGSVVTCIDGMVRL
jgi:PhzF family phenazine biosynthesis protein